MQVIHKETPLLVRNPVLLSSFAVGSIVVSQPAQRRTIHFLLPQSRSMMERHRSYFLSFPRLLFKIEYKILISENHVSWRYWLHDFHVGAIYTENPEENSRVHEISLPNIDAFFVCLGTNIEANSLDELVNKTLDRFWSSYFVALSGNLDFYEEWRKHTLEDPNWVPKDEALFYSTTYKDFLGSDLMSSIPRLHIDGPYEETQAGI